MHRNYKIPQSMLISMFILAAAVSVFSQQKQPAGSGVVFQREVQGPVVTQLPRPGEPDAFYFVSSEMTFEGKLVKGAPYSAHAITETTQTLSDGNRIVNKSTALLYRDGEGRTRREQTLRTIGPFATAYEAPQTIFINDPVSGVSYMLDSGTHTARKMPTRRFEYKIATPGEGDKLPPPSEGQGPLPMKQRRDNSDFIVDVVPPGISGAVAGGSGARWEIHSSQAKEAKTESLGKQSIEGVEAEGTRTTFTIPAGEIGNERAIEVVSERWYSPDLQTVVMTKHSDPRFGETVYRLANIDRSEPAKSLFEVPADYNLRDTTGVGVSTFSSGSGENARFRTISGGVLNGKAINLPQPEYPAIARQAGASGSVTVEITIDEDGNVSAAHAVAGHPLLQAAAVAAARQAKFAPTKLEGKPVKIQGAVVYNFAVTSNPEQ